MQGKEIKIGMRSGRLTITEYLGVIQHRKGKKRSFHKCLCDCGTETIVQSNSIGVTKSCGCARKETLSRVLKTHGEGKDKTVEYSTWIGIKSRCKSTRKEKKSQYLDRGITVCERWINSYENFLIDMGRRPKGKNSIDRIDVNKGYSPDNCRWSDRFEQANNTTASVYIEYKNYKFTLKQWANKLNMNYSTFMYHLKVAKKNIKEIAHFKKIDI